jgi:hypothetical protein
MQLASRLGHASPRCGSKAARLLIFSCRLPLSESSSCNVRGFSQATGGPSQWFPVRNRPHKQPSCRPQVHHVERAASPTDLDAAGPSERVASGLTRLSRLRLLSFYCVVLRAASSALHRHHFIRWIIIIIINVSGGKATAGHHHNYHQYHTLDTSPISLIMWSDSSSSDSILDSLL